MRITNNTQANFKGSVFQIYKTEKYIVDTFCQTFKPSSTAINGNKFVTFFMKEANRDAEIMEKLRTIHGLRWGFKAEVNPEDLSFYSFQDGRTSKISGWVFGDSRFSRLA